MGRYEWHNSLYDYKTTDYTDFTDYMSFGYEISICITQISEEHATQVLNVIPCDLLKALKGG